MISVRVGDDDSHQVSSHSLTISPVLFSVPLKKTRQLRRQKQSHYFLPVSLASFLSLMIDCPLIFFTWLCCLWSVRDKQQTERNQDWLLSNCLLFLIPLSVFTSKDQGSWHWDGRQRLLLPTSGRSLKTRRLVVSPETRNWTVSIIYWVNRDGDDVSIVCRILPDPPSIQRLWLESLNNWLLQYLSFIQGSWWNFDLPFLLQEKRSPITLTDKV